MIDLFWKIPLGILAWASVGGLLIAVLGALEQRYTISDWFRRR